MDRLRDRWRALLQRARRLERREVREFRAWLETTRNLVHLSVLVVVPLLLALVTELSNVVTVLPFVVFPPLASGTYTLFAEPEGRYSSPTTFVGGLTAGAACGGVALLISVHALGPPPDATADRLLPAVSPAAAALAVFLTGAVTWGFDLEVPSAFSTALLVLVVPAGRAVAGVREMLDAVVAPYVVGVAVFGAVVAGAFHVWRDRVYERRAEFLYQSTKGDDHVLVPMRSERAPASAMLGARLAAAHDAGKVVLLDVVAGEDVAAAERALLERDERTGGESHAAPEATDAPEADVTPDAPARPAGTDRTESDDSPGEIDAGAEVESTARSDLVADDLEALAEERAVAETATELERLAGRVETEVGVPCEVVVAVVSASRAATVLTAAHRTNCDLIVTPYEDEYGMLSPFVRELFRGDTDVLVHRSAGETPLTRWRDVLVPVRQASDAAHAMLDFATRLAGSSGRIAACHCIGRRGDRRRAESMLSDLVGTVRGNVETRVSRLTIEEFLERTAPQFDLVVIGASTDRSAASRFVSPPTFERIQDLECDVAILDRNYRF